MSEGNKDLATRVQALEDRIAIEEIFHAYFGYGRSKNHAGLTGFFAPDFYLDINGAVCTNEADLLALYKKVGASKPRLTGKFHMQLTNFLIKIDGDKATCSLLWTQQLNDTIKGPPRYIEQGREFDWLIKIDGVWKIKKRVVIADSGSPDCFDDTWTPRLDFSFETEAAPW